MGVLDDMGRLWDASKNNPRPGFADGIKKAADAAEKANEFRAASAAAQAGAPSANPFVNAAAMNSAIRGSGVVTALTDTGQKFETTTIYDVSLDVTIDGEAPYSVVHRQMIAAAALGNWQPGKVITLRVDPVDKTKVMLG
ncbi:MAG: hypothetical protein EPN91_04380 [Salinibacterium sp.]|nr:MAG: hypothetical protein EPN91_04380 [Salinibacterium sp.]